MGYVRRSRLKQKNGDNVIFFEDIQVMLTVREIPYSIKLDLYQLLISFLFNLMCVICILNAVIDTFLCNLI